MRSCRRRSRTAADYFSRAGSFEGMTTSSAPRSSSIPSTSPSRPAPTRAIRPSRMLNASPSKCKRTMCVSPPLLPPASADPLPHTDRHPLLRRSSRQPFRRRYPRGGPPLRRQLSPSSRRPRHSRASPLALHAQSLFAATRVGGLVSSREERVRGPEGGELAVPAAGDGGGNPLCGRQEGRYHDVDWRRWGAGSESGESSFMCVRESGN